MGVLVLAVNTYSWCSASLGHFYTDRYGKRVNCVIVVRQSILGCYLLTDFHVSAIGGKYPTPHTHKYITQKKVVWLGKPEVEVTWEAAHTFSPAIIEEFERGVQAEVVAQTEVHYGYQMTTLSVSSYTSQQQPVKKARKERPVVESTTG